MAGSASLALRVVGAVAAGAAVIAAAGCASGGSSSVAASAPASSSAATSAAASAATSAPAASSSPAASTTPPAATSPHAVASSSPASTGPAGCATRDLQVKAGVAQGAAGSTYQVIVFTNISNATCTMYGYPGVSLASGKPVTQVGMAASRSTVAGPTVVTLAPGKAGNALLRITEALNYPSNTCSPAKTAYLQIYPPNQTTAIYLAYATTGCSSHSVNLLSIGVVQAGAGSGQ
jgi:uncharacterized protein DUF4232